MNVKSIRIEDFDYPLPDNRIALHPLPRRDGCNLLHVNGGGEISHAIFSDLPDLLAPETLIIANETKVIRARMEFHKESGARIEVFLLEPLNPNDYVLNFASTKSCTWSCMVGNRKKWKEGELKRVLKIDGKRVTLKIKRGADLPGNAVEIRFSWRNPRVTFAEIIEAAGNIPIPPYLNRDSEERDTEDYQTVYSRNDGSVAAPTAGLHFTPELLERLRNEGHDFATVTLHVGAGTFQPVKSEAIGDHPMHTEWISVGRSTIEKIIEALREGRDILAVGTTSVRTLESLPYLGMNCGEGAPGEVTQWMPYGEEAANVDTMQSLQNLVGRMEARGEESLEANTSIMIAPGFEWRIVNKLITNFHQPKSTLLLLVSSFLGGDEWRTVYDEALANGYRFLSYGDACLFERDASGARHEDAIHLPYSKSMFLRLAAITAIRDPKGLAALRPYADCVDSSRFLDALQTILPPKPYPSPCPVYLNIGDGAAPSRFFAAIAASTAGSDVLLDGSESLRIRPISPLVESLRQAGADIRYTQREGRLPILIHGKRLDGNVTTDTSYSSQYLSALMMASELWGNRYYLPRSKRPRLYRDISIESPISAPYLRMTRQMLDKEEFCRPGRCLEPDWSSAAFFYELLMIMASAGIWPEEKSLKFARLTPPAESMQGDAACCEIFAELGLRTQFNGDGSAEISFDRERMEQTEYFERDMSDTPDLVLPLAVALTVSGIPFRLTGTGNLRFKESDRAQVLREELARLGYRIETGKDYITFDARREVDEITEPVTIDSHGDHRIAMAFAPLEILGKGTVDHREVAGKSFPLFWDELEKIK